MTARPAGEAWTEDEVAARIDHAVLTPTLTDRDLSAAVMMCLRRRVGCLCVRPSDVVTAATMLAGQPVRVAAVIGFPHGSHRTETKAFEAGLAIADGAVELDMVMNLPAFFSARYSDVEADIAAVVAVAGAPQGASTRHGATTRPIVKVILETSLLTAEQIATACRIAEGAGADFVKTSTGFSGGGATREAVAVMLDTVQGRVGVKASGGIRSWTEAIGFLDMGCTRIGVGDAGRILDGVPRPRS